MKRLSNNLAVGTDYHIVKTSNSVLRKTQQWPSERKKQMISSWSARTFHDRQKYIRDNEVLLIRFVCKSFDPFNGE